jgi:hypothetical protein
MPSIGESTSNETGLCVQNDLRHRARSFGDTSIDQCLWASAQFEHKGPRQYSLLGLAYTGIGWSSMQHHAPVDLNSRFSMTVVVSV